MQSQIMDHFTYKNHLLHCDEVPVPALELNPSHLLTLHNKSETMIT